MRRAVPVLPEIVKKMNEENSEMRFSLIESRRRNEPKYIGVRIVI